MEMLRYHKSPAPYNTAATDTATTTTSPKAHLHGFPLSATQQHLKARASLSKLLARYYGYQKRKENHPSSCKSEKHRRKIATATPAESP